jgi:RNA polymerase sigma-70 factor, ECF subfamily
MLAHLVTLQLSRTIQKSSAMPAKPASADAADDLDLIRSIQEKNDSALQELFAAYGQRLYTYALRLTGDPSQAEDVVQDALVVVWKSAGAFRGEGRLIAWLMRIVHHTALKSLRRQPVFLTEEIENKLFTADPQPEESVQTSEQNEWLRRGLERLSPEHRAVLELVFYQGLSLAETAQVCDCPLGTVKSRLSYARKQLRGVLSRVEEIE